MDVKVREAQVRKEARPRKQKSKPKEETADDIPVAQRDLPATASKAAERRNSWISGVLALSAIAVVSGAVWAALESLPEISRWANDLLGRSPDSLATEDVAGDRTLSSISVDSDAPDEEPTEPPQPTLLGHRKYEEASLDELEPIVADESIKLRAAAAESFLEMQAAAAEDEVYLVPISGFRSFETQDSLFFDIKAQRRQGPEERAEVSAPPGYSEHHTGYAIDIGDEDVPATNVSPAFEKTAAFEWLEENAAEYQFELSFPRGNPQGVSYEPWHWRFVGDRDSLETFYSNAPSEKAPSLKEAPNEEAESESESESDE